MLPYKYLSTVNFACSNEAGKYLYGNKKFEVIPNVIDVEKFKYNENDRNEIRKKYNLNITDTSLKTSYESTINNINKQ